MSSGHDRSGLHAAGSAWLFCPGDRPDRFKKAAMAADLMILDLEDAVTADAKRTARAAIVSASSTLDPNRTIVRVNPSDTPSGREDLLALAATPLSTIMLPKAHTTAQLDVLDGFSVVPLCETATGVLAASQLASHPRSVALAWGGQDLALDLDASPLGADGSLHPTAVWARMAVRFAAASARVPAIDTVWVDLEDEEGLASEARSAADAGYHAKLVVHPRQVATVRAAFAPAASEVAMARRIVAAAQDAAARGTGTIQVEGGMVDAPIVARAHRVIARAHDSEQQCP